MEIMYETVEDAIEDIKVEKLKPNKEADLKRLNDLFIEISKLLFMWEVECLGKLEVKSSLSVELFDRFVNIAKTKLFDIESCIQYAEKQLELSYIPAGIDEIIREFAEKILCLIRKKKLSPQYAMAATNHNRENGYFQERLRSFLAILKTAEIELNKAKSHNDIEVSAQV